MAIDKNNPLGLDIEVEGEDNLKKALSKSEKAYLAMSKAILKVADGLREDTKESKENEEEHTKDSKKTKKERGKLSKSLLGFLSREKEAAADAGFSFKALTGFIGGGALIGAVVGATRSFVSWDNQLGELRSTIDDLPGEISATGDQIRVMSAELGISRQELIETTKQMADLGLAGGKISSKEFIDLRKTTVELAQGMGIASGSVVDLMDTLSRTYNLPHHRLRGIATSMKFIQESTGMTGDEIISFAKSLDEIQARMTGGGEARADMIRDFGAVAGALKKAGVDASGLPKLFAEALDPESNKGAEFLGFLQDHTGKAMEDIRKQLQAGDVAGITELFIESLGKVGPDELIRFGSFYRDMTDMSTPDLLRLGKITKKTFRDTVEAVRKSEHDQKLLFESAAARQSKLTKSWARFKLFFEDLWLGLGEVVATVAASWVDDLKFLRDQGLAHLQNALEWFRSSEGKEATQRWMERAKELAKDLGVWVVKLGEKVSVLIDWWSGMSESNQDLVLGLGGALLLFGKFGPLLTALGGPITAVVAGLTAVYLGAQKIADWIDENQDRELAATNEVQRTTSEIKMAQQTLTDNKRSREQQIGDIKALIGKGEGKRLITAEGEINEAEIKRRMEAIPDRLEKNIFKNATTKALEGIQKMPLFKEALEKRKTEVRHLDAINNAGTEVGAMGLASTNVAAGSGAVTDVAAPFSMAPQTNVPSMLAAPDISPVRTPQIPTMDDGNKGPQVVAVQNSGTTDMILKQIHGLLGGAIARMGSRPAPTHASRPAIANALGG